MKTAYPVIFTDVGTNILIEVPDLNILTEANEEGKPKGTIADAMKMARDAIGLEYIALEDIGKDITPPSDISSVDVKKGTFVDCGQGFLSMVDVDVTEYRKRADNRTVRRNVTLPNWLNVEAERAHINVSKTLQEALMVKLGVTAR
ncbi:MAG: type II toxin-antitoxin system HicB family antitoxin [Lachnospiraceae bacterium]|nr:type II toxin-antitoxin system HicB family antitoxin [Lachnospiraceae bacterium]